MRVLHINGNYIMSPSLHQGMIRHLTECGVKSKVFVPTFDKLRTQEKLDDNVTVSECFRKNDRFFFDYKQTKMIKSVEQNDNVSNFDIIHAYTLFTDGNCAMKLAEKYHKPFVIAVRNTDVNTFFKYRINLRRRGIKIMQRASAIFFLSEAYRQQVFTKYVPKDLYNELYKKTYIIPNGIDDFWFENNYIERDIETTLDSFAEKRLRIVYAGEISRNKNITTTCKAVEILKKQGWNIEITVVGKIIEKSEFEKIKNYVTYLEARPKEQLIDVYRAADIFVMPSLTETFGLVYAEAMTQGLPVLYSKGQGFDGQFEEGVAGYAVDSHSPEDIANKILQTIKNYVQIAPNCPKLAEKFQWDRIVKSYNDIYRKLIISQV